MKPAAFDYIRADSVEAVLQQLAAGAGQAKVIAGGQSFGPMLNMRLATPAALIDLNDLSELATLRDIGGALEVGALTRHYQLAESALVQQRCPLLAQAARTIGHYAIRQRGTLGGSLAHADPAAQLPLVAVTLQASIELLSSRGRRSLPAAEFFLSAMTTALQPDEIIECVRFPTAAAAEGSAFKLFNRRRGDFAIVAVAATLALEDGRIGSVRLGIGGVDAVPRSYEALVQPLVGHVPEAGWVAAAARAVEAALTPEDDARIPAQYRRELARSLVQQALERALARARAPQEERS